MDFRKGPEGLAALVSEEMPVRSVLGTIYVFRARRADRVKLVWDGTGVCLFAKRLEAILQRPVDPLDPAPSAVW